ncbi:protein NLP7-like [Solanum tuberosum]|uniref:Transcription factor n=1 Tax=Solanum tuberosum TaxID=4113 RepID=M1B293_SOLTU|nr:PREDICTED: protein NLP7-like [Solanum tuberosum]XP_015167195.1 PREDICTED: protein NLP7-like [Solanum tuberosum]
MYHEFEYSSEVCLIESRKALVGRAFASQGSCFCKDVTLLSIEEYPLVPGAQKARFTQSFAICLQSKCANKFICVVEYFLPPNEMVVRDTKIFLNMLLSTMKEQYLGFIVAPGNELGQRMLVEVLKDSPSDELDSFEIGQTLLSVQSLQDGGETTEVGQRLSSVQRIEKDYGITRKILEEHYGMTLQDAAKNLRISRATLKRICRENEIARCQITRLERLMSMLAKAYLFKMLNHMWAINNVLLFPKKKAPNI